MYDWWEDVAIATWENRVANVGNPVLVLSNGSPGIDLVFFYIQYTCYNIEATFVLFWAFSLLASVYGWSFKPRWRKTFARINIAGKIMSVVLPLITICLLQVRAIQESYVAFLVVADFEFIVSCGGGAMFLLMILVRYVQSRSNFGTWTVGYGRDLETSDTDTRRSYGPPSSTNKRRRARGIYDKWLIIRFTIAFVALAIFECSITTFQVTGQQNNSVDYLSDAPNTSASKAIRVAVQDLPGVTASLVPFIVFGTTRPFREKMYDTFVPRWWRRRGEDERRKKRRDTGGPYTTRSSMSQRAPFTSIRVSKGVDISYSMNELTPTRSSSHYETRSSDDEKLMPLSPLSPPAPTATRVPAKGPWEDRWEQEATLHGVRWEISAGGHNNHGVQSRR
ncbi:Chromosome transmission fidelity protein 18 [Pestalotiopsis sp. IQ-011]